MLVPVDNRASMRKVLPDSGRYGVKVSSDGQVEYLAYEDGAPLLFYTGTYRHLEVQLWDDLYIW